MSDPRLRKLLEAARRMRQGDFGVDLPPQPGADDEVGELSLALLDLSHELDQRFTELRAVAQVAEKVSAGVVLEQVCDQVYETFRGLIPYDRIGLAMLEDEGETLQARWARSEAGVVHLLPGYTASMEGSSLQRILETGEPRILNDLERYQQEHPDSESTRLVVAEGVRSSLTCPLVTEDGAVGFLFFSSFEKETYREAHVDLYEAIAAQLSVIVAKTRLYEELVALDAFRTRMLGMVAHDLRNPLTLVLTSLELLEMGAGGALDESGRALVDRATRASERMVALLEDLLDVSAIEVGRLVLEEEEAELGRWLRGVVEEQRPIAHHKGTRVELALSPGALKVCADLERLSQVVVNLIGNAIKYAPAGSTVTVTAGENDDGAWISVADEGPGISEDERALLFEPFGRTSNQPTGGESSTGLGLAISQRIIEAHGGRITVYSTVGEGTTFTVWLPRSAALEAAR